VTAVRTEVTKDGVAVLTLDGADRLNVFSAQTAADLGAAYRRCDTDDSVRAVVVTGAGRARSRRFVAAWSAMPSLTGRCVMPSVSPSPPICC
jgi:1,4-dihydroxy-2-naphthoyl-CoA synthase